MADVRRVPSLNVVERYPTTTQPSTTRIMVEQSVLPDYGREHSLGTLISRPNPYEFLWSVLEEVSKNMADVRRVLSPMISVRYAFCAFSTPPYSISNLLLRYSSALKLSALFQPFGRMVDAVFGFHHLKRLSAILAFTPARFLISGQAIVVHILVSVVTPGTND
jgi:hypothetical protein